MNFNEAHKYLDDLQFFGIKLGLDQVHELLSYFNHPEHSLKFIHIAGTNGKGSVSAMLASALHATGCNVGLYTSPHLVSVRERFRINGKAISHNDFAELIQMIKPFVEKMKSENRCPTYFEVTSVIAALYFAREKVDFIVWETGLGGRFDATNIVTPICSVITEIALDHQIHLGNTIERITREKAGIIKAGKPVFFAEISPKAAEIIIAHAKKCKAPYKCIDKKYLVSNLAVTEKKGRIFQVFTIENRSICLSLGGKKQLENVKLFYMVFKWLSEKYRLNLQDGLEGLKSINWMGRFQILPDGNIVDGAHNPQGIDALVDYIHELTPEKKYTIVFANFSDKNAAENISKLCPIAEKFIFVTVKSGKKRSYSTDELKEFLKKTNYKIPVTTAESPHQILTSESHRELIFTGSLYLAGDVLKEYYSEEEIINLIPE